MSSPSQPRSDLQLLYDKASGNPSQIAAVRSLDLAMYTVVSVEAAQIKWRAAAQQSRRQDESAQSALRAAAADLSKRFADAVSDVEASMYGVRHRFQDAESQALFGAIQDRLNKR